MMEQHLPVEKRLPLLVGNHIIKLTRLSSCNFSDSASYCVINVFLLDEAFKYEIYDTWNP